jgi:hypothetical protein
MVVENVIKSSLIIDLRKEEEATVAKVESKE